MERTHIFPKAVLKTKKCRFDLYVSTFASILAQNLKSSKNINKFYLLGHCRITKDAKNTNIKLRKDSDSL